MAEVRDRDGKLLDWRWITETCEARDYRCCDGAPGVQWAGCMVNGTDGQVAW